MNTIIRAVVPVVLGGVILLAGITTAEASHSWGGYHWARTANPFMLTLGDNVTAAWDSYLSTASSDWSVSNVLDTSIIPGKNVSNPKRCRSTYGRVEVCNAAYGSNGWLGVAQVWVSGSHITQGTVRLNDTYFKTAAYNTPAWKNLVMCQEVGHTFGLDHQDENFNNPNLGTCMDYTDSPSRDDGTGGNEHPNQHDYDMLEEIYAHLDSVSTVLTAKTAGASALAQNGEFENASEWGTVIRNSSDGRPSVLVREDNRRQKVFTFVIWADLGAESH